MKKRKALPSASQRLYLDLQKRILSGEFGVGAAMPTVRSLAASYETSVNTVQRVMARLESDGFINCRVGRNNIVAPVAKGGGTPGERERVALISLDGATALERMTKREWPNLWGYQINGATQDALAAENIDCFTMSPRGDKRGKKPSWEELLTGPFSVVSGIILFPNFASGLTADDLAKAPVPVVTINRVGFWQTANFVNADYISVGGEIADAFASQDFREVLFIGSLTYKSSFKEVCLGFVSRTLEMGRSLSGIENVDIYTVSEAHGHAAMRQYLKDHGKAPQAVLTPGDYSALGAIRALRESGFKVPEDVHVIGLTGLEMSEFTNPPLSVVAQPIKEIGVQAAKMMTRLIRGPEKELPGVIIPTGMIWRDSAPRTKKRSAEAHAKK